MPREFTEIGSDDAFFWSSLEFGGKVYFGGYGYPKGYNYPPWTLIKSFAAGESIPRMDIFLGTIFCATENLGKIYKMNPADPTDWTVVHDDDWLWGLGIAACGSYIYAGFKTTGQDQTKTLYSSNGNDWYLAEQVAASIPELFAFDGKVYELGCTNAGKLYARRGTTTSWAAVGVLCPDVAGSWRIGQLFGGYFYVGAGEMSDGKARVYRFDGTTLSGELISQTGYKPHYACVCDGKMYWLFGPHMNQVSSATVYYYLYVTPTGNSGDWEHIKTFAATPILSHGKYRTKGTLSPLGNALYVGVQNKVYRMTEARQAIFI